MLNNDQPHVGEKDTSSVLDGVNVLDLSRFIAGPSCAQMLADFGAEVVKVERPSGEDPRHHEPYYRGESIYPMLYNRNKYGATLDTRNPAALAILEKYIAWADIVIENYRPGTIEKMGISFDRMREINPDIILVSLSGYGQTGPNSQRALFDAISQASSGLMSITGEEDGSPMLTGTYVADYVAGFHGAIGALVAILHRERTGEGQLVDIASQDATFSMLGIRLISWLMLGEEMPRSGNRDLLTAPVNVYPSKDGDVYIQAGTNGLFPRLCKALNREDLLEVEEFKTVPGRMENQDFLESVVAKWASSQSSDEIIEQMEIAGIPCSKVETIPDVVASEQIKAREMVVSVDHPVLGELKIPGNPIKMSHSPARVRKAPPLCGEDNTFVYRQLLGLDDDEYQQLRSSGALG